uniref:Uncharacterized protein n=1 Tax=Cacopsylla melanoneura TaxID=428564 RepID=A0A8D8T0M8_9HEMI
MTPCRRRSGFQRMRRIFLTRALWKYIDDQIIWLTSTLRRVAFPTLTTEIVVRQIAMATECMFQHIDTTEMVLARVNVNIIVHHAHFVFTFASALLVTTRFHSEFTRMLFDRSRVTS